jgi:hypothetical protein
LGNLCRKGMMGCHECQWSSILEYGYDVAVWEMKTMCVDMMVMVGE